MLMRIVCWIELGLVASLFASRSFNRRGKGIPMNIALGIVGALMGGLLLRFVAGSTGTMGFDGWSLCGALVGAAMLLSIRQMVRHFVSRASSLQALESNKATEYAS